MTGTTERKPKGVSLEEFNDFVKAIDSAQLETMELDIKTRLDSIHRMMSVAGATPSLFIVSRADFKRLQEARQSPSSNGEIPTPRRKAAKPPKAKGGRTQRGQGRATIEGTLKKLGGKGSTKDLKAAWEAIGSKTPLSVAMAGGVTGGWLKRTGKGRKAVYSLA